MLCNDCRYATGLKQGVVDPEKLKGSNANLFNDAITHVVKTRRIFDAPEKSDMMLNRIKDEYEYRTSNDTNFIIIRI